ncbi:hypothetical protein TNCV_2889061 [Trichonephila clavipes]|nr:hypothetical protein TNCV_2889061 [Trichonephila clavipes]
MDNLGLQDTSALWNPHPLYSEFLITNLLELELGIRPVQSSMQEPEEIGNVIEEVVNLARQINLEVDSDDVQELLDSQHQELAIDELVEMHARIRASH